MKTNALSVLFFFTTLMGTLIIPQTAAYAAQKDRAASPQSLTVIELYTSQGCSSCPPADAYLGELAKRDDLLPLSFHVDYWDYIGWKDTNALPHNGTRQRSYARQFGLRYVYTPQMVIQGSGQVTGSDKSSIEEQIAKAQQTARPLPMSLTRQAGDTIVLSIPAAPVKQDARILLVGFDKEQQTIIKRGENRGKTISYHNIVRHLDEIGQWSGDEFRLPLTLPDMTSTDFDACAVLLQDKGNGHILGAVRLDLR